MISIWERAFGKLNRDTNTILYLSEELIDFKDDTSCDSIAEAINLLAHKKHWPFEQTGEDPYEQLLIDWETARRLGILDKAVVRAIEHQNDRDTDNNKKRLGPFSLLSIG